MKCCFDFGRENHIIQYWKQHYFTENDSVELYMIGVRRIVSSAKKHD